jgi:acyl-coenzyme A synthetase/AMP-(fatty) acid ligase
VLNVGGHKLGVERLEAALQSHRQCRCRGCRAFAGQAFWDRIAALVEVSSAVDKSELAQICVDRYGSFARPAELFFVDTIPVTANGKIDRQKAAALVSQLSGQS